MTGQRVLLLGPTGIDKDTAVGNLANYQKNHHGDVKFQHIGFEKILCTETKRKPFKIQSFLDKPPAEQKNMWLKAWGVLADKHLPGGPEDKAIVLSIHGVITRKTYGIRSPINIQKIMEIFRPTMIITLIDDVYLLWHRTTERAKEFEFLGTPTLAQLLETRRAEIFLGDLIAKQAVGSNDLIPHYVLSIWHPARVLDRLIFNERNLVIGYMSFPISRPRKAELAGDSTVITELNTYFKEISDFEARNPNVAFFCPLCIDELPLVKNELPEQPKEHTDDKSISIFSTSLRWRVTDFYKDTLLLTDPSKIPAEICIPSEQIKLAEGFIREDVTTRDYRLVAQSDFLAVLNPVMLNPDTKIRSVSGGVRNEIMAAMFENKQIHVFQDAKHDPDDKFGQEYRVTSSAMGGLAPGAGNIRKHASVDDLLKQSLRDLRVSTAS